MFSTSVWIFLAVAALAYYWLKPKKREINLPGPTPLPLIGNMHEFDKSGKFYAVFVKWQKKYGPLVKIRLGMQGNVVLVGDPAIAKEMLAMDAFVGRAYVKEFTLFEGENRGLINSEGELWEHQRRFVVRNLRDFGFGKNSMESVTMEEVNEIIETFSNAKGKPMDDIKSKLSLATVNALWSIVAGKRYPQNDPKLREIARQLTGAFDDVGKSGAIIAILPSLKHVIPRLSGYTSVRKLMSDLAEFVRSEVKEHKETFQEDSERDFIDVYLKEMKSSNNPGPGFVGKDGEKQLIAVVADLFQAGADTISTVLNWGILFLLKHPEIQRKMQEEIDRVVGNSRHVSLTDRSSMVYTQAFINEVLRKSSPPFGVPHRVIKDTEFRGVFYPKGTSIMINLEFIHNDPKHWNGDPENFRPERFLSPDEKKLIKNDVLNPFLVGRRQCPGETLAKDAVFLFLTNLVQKFNFVRDPAAPEPDTEPAPSVVVSPKPYSIIFQERIK